MFISNSNHSARRFSRRKGFTPAPVRTRTTGAAWPWRIRNAAAQRVLFHLQAAARGENILKDGRGSALVAQTVLPANLHHVGAQHPDFRSPVVHTCLIGGWDRRLYTTGIRSDTICR